MNLNYHLFFNTRKLLLSILNTIMYIVSILFCFVFIILSRTIIVVCTTKINANVSMVLSFLYKCVRVFCEYFKELEEESIRDNFVIVYELLDELMDFGFPQSTESKILQEYITQEGNKLEEVRPPPALTQTVSWRSEGLKYRKNEVFLDVIESVNLLVNLRFIYICIYNKMIINSLFVYL